MPKRGRPPLPSALRRRRLIAYVVAPLALGMICLATIAFVLLPVSPAPPVKGIEVDADAAGRFRFAAVDITIGVLGRSPEPQILPSRVTRLDVAIADCDSTATVDLAVNPDPRWWRVLRASRRGRSARISIARDRWGRRVIPPGLVDGVLTIAIPGEVDRVTAFTRGRRKADLLPVRALPATEESRGFSAFTARITRPALRHVDYFGGAVPVHFRFRADWTTARSFSTCWATLPALVSGQASFFHAARGSGLAAAADTSTRARGPTAGSTRLVVADGVLSRSATAPLPVGSAIVPTWTCSRGPYPSPRPGPDCHANAVIEDPEMEQLGQLLLLAVGALGTACLIGALAAIRRLLVPWSD